ncbi:Cys/Met metabolism, pyridoxal phosphate-dependent enzyme [Ophiocordyceps camponoti-floridani]|uniref:Cys/Met metabolism, pyridoxal phosphate-dependent enzyme n=1 Tax=Ophiocordyceps camponoti-floridani TaxID=2030778 RepID=A0A8H4VGJ2_9HYPO|nr:Cys/Met metabolism, pyridoxal phosphate-dependent enzyme [Ophiocordyceps camponoti-floridani]
MLFPSETMARACERHLRDRSDDSQASAIVRLTIRIDGSFKTQDDDRQQENVSMVLHPQTLAAEAKAFWQHTGFGISSRFAAHWLKTAPFLGGEPERLPLKEARDAGLALGSRIAGLYSTGPDDVFLYHTGMSAMAHAASAIRRLGGEVGKGFRVVVFGFPYVDTFKVLSKVYGFDCVLYGHASARELDELEAGLETGSRLDVVVTEFPGNPLLRSVHLARLKALSRKHGFYIIIDDTIGTAVNLDLGSSYDLVCTSLTKMFSGACNVMGGSVVVGPRCRNRDSLREALSDLYEDTYFPLDVIVMNTNSVGFESRVQLASRNAEKVVDRLRHHRLVETVYYPRGSPTQHLYDDFRRPGAGYGYLLSIEFVEPAAATAFFDALDVAKGPSLGTNFTICCAYTLLAHASELDWAAGYGVREHLVRISVGIEEEESLLALVEVALAAAELRCPVREGGLK